MVNRVERHIFVNNDTLEELCRKAKLFYNYTNFQIRKVIGDDFLNIANKSCISQSIRINPLKIFVKNLKNNNNYQGFNLILSGNC